MKKILMYWFVFANRLFLNTSTTVSVITVIVLYIDIILFTNLKWLSTNNEYVNMGMVSYSIFFYVNSLVDILLLFKELVS